MRIRVKENTQPIADGRSGAGQVGAPTGAAPLARARQRTTGAAVPSEGSQHTARGNGANAARGCGNAPANGTGDTGRNLAATEGTAHSGRNRQAVSTGNRFTRTSGTGSGEPENRNGHNHAGRSIAPTNMPATGSRATQPSGTDSGEPENRRGRNHTGRIASGRNRAATGSRATQPSGTDSGEPENRRGRNHTGRIASGRNRAASDGARTALTGNEQTGSGDAGDGTRRPERSASGRQTVEADQPARRNIKLFGGDPALWIIIVALAIVSLLVIYSSTASLAYKDRGGDTTYFLYTQFKFIFIGFIAIWVVHRFNYQTYSKYTRLLFIISLILMVMTFFIGEETNEAIRSIRIPLINLTFQPADFIKITLVMVLAKELSRRQKGISKMELLPVRPLFRGISEKRRLKNREVLHDTTLPLLLPVVLGCGLIFRSNFSTSALVFVTCMIMLFVGRVRVRELWRIMRITLVSVALLVTVMYAFDYGRSGVWVSRLGSFVGMEIEMKDDTKRETELRARERNENQVMQAKMAIASGELIGRGPGHSVQRSNLPLPFSDYVYAFIAEEYGLLGAVVVLALFLWLFFRTVVIFRRCEKTFPSLLVLGLGIMIVLQAFINMLVAVDLFPVTGLPMPYISLGGSSVLFTSIALGMILGVSRQMQEKTLEEPE